MYRWVTLKKDREMGRRKKLEDSGEEELKLRSAAPSRREIEKEVFNKKLALAKERKGLRKKCSILSTRRKERDLNESSEFSERSDDLYKIKEESN